MTSYLMKNLTKHKFEIQVYFASSLGNENTLNMALSIGTTDIIYTDIRFDDAYVKATMPILEPMIAV